MAAGVGTPLRSIPAWAGETGSARPLLLIPWVYPRVGGGNVGKERLRLT